MKVVGGVSFLFYFFFAKRVEPRLKCAHRMCWFLRLNKTLYEERRRSCVIVMCWF